MSENDQAGESTTIHFNFTISTVNETHWMNVTFPTGFDISGAGIACDQATGETATPYGQALNISKIVDAYGTDVVSKCAISNVVNPDTAAISGTTSSQFTVIVRNSTTTLENGVSIGTLTTRPAQPAAANSTLSASATTITSGSSSTITATLKDAKNNTNGTVQTVEWDQGNGTWTAMTSAGSGTYTATFNNATAATYTIKARFTSPSTTTITQTVSVTVNAAASSTTTSTGAGTDTGSGSGETSSGTKSGSEAQSSDADSTEHTLEYSGERGIRSIDVTLKDSGPVAFQTTTKDQTADGLPSGFKSTAFWIDIKQTKGGAVDSASVTLGPFDAGFFEDDPDSFVVFHGVGESWVELPTKVTKNADGTFTVTFTTDSFSPFIMAVSAAALDEEDTSKDESAEEEETGDVMKDEESEGTPGFGVLAAIAMLAAALVARRRRDV